MGRAGRVRTPPRGLTLAAGGRDLSGTNAAGGAKLQHVSAVMVFDDFPRNVARKAGKPVRKERYVKT